MRERDVVDVGVGAEEEASVCCGVDCGDRSEEEPDEDGSEGEGVDCEGHEEDGEGEDEKATEKREVDLLTVSGRSDEVRDGGSSEVDRIGSVTASRSMGFTDPDEGGPE